MQRYFVLVFWLLWYLVGGFELCCVDGAVAVELYMVVQFDDVVVGLVGWYLYVGVGFCVVVGLWQRLVEWMIEHVVQVVCFDVGDVLDEVEQVRVGWCYWLLDVVF